MFVITLVCHPCKRNETLVEWDLPPLFQVGCIVCRSTVKLTQPPSQYLHTTALFDKVTGKFLLHVNVQNVS